MSEEALTHAEVGALIGATEKAATQLGALVGQMTIIVSTQQQIILLQEKILGRLMEDLPKVLAEKIVPHVEVIVPDVKEIRERMKELEKQQRWQGWVITATGGTVGLIALIKLILWPLISGKP